MADTPTPLTTLPSHPVYPGKRAIWTLAAASLLSGALVVLLIVRLISAGNAVAASNPGSPLVGRHAPDFTITLWNGPTGQPQTVRLADLKGRPVVVNFWASWCDTCVQEQALLNAAWQKYHDRGVAFVGVAMNDKQPDGVAYLQKQGVAYPSGPDATGQIIVDYGVTGPPETAFINRAGVVTYKQIGPVDDITLDHAIQTLLK